MTASSVMRILLVTFFGWLLIASVADDTAARRQRQKRQVSLENIIERALNLVRPIIDTSQPLQDDTTIPKQLAAETVSYRDSEILGSQRYSSFQDVPICRGNSAICKFISCTAHNFKNDQSFSNLNLAAQVLSDTKLRKGISNDPDALLAVCHEQGLSKPQCKLFAKGFQLIDKFFTTIESRDPARRVTADVVQDVPYEEDTEADAPPIPIRPHDPQNDSPVIGSRTWSSHPKQIEPVIQYPTPPTPPSPPTFGTLPTLPPLLFTFPTLPTLPPFLPPENFFKESKTTSLSTAFSSDNDVNHNPFTPPLPAFPTFARFQRSVDLMSPDHEDNSERSEREKRGTDYYDQVDDEAVSVGKKNSIEQNDHRIRQDDGFDRTRPLYDDYTQRSSNYDRWSGKAEKAGDMNGYINCFQYLDHTDLHLR